MLLPMPTYQNRTIQHIQCYQKENHEVKFCISEVTDVGRVAVMQDITHLKELDRMKSEFVSTVSHDLRSPLTSVKGFADLMPVVGSLNDQQQDFVAKIQRGVATITELVSDLLDLGRIEA